MTEGRQSPPPERQTGAQQQSPPGSGKGTGNPANQDKEALKSQLEVCLTFYEHNIFVDWFVDMDCAQNLESNPKGPMDDHVKEMFAKKAKEQS